uniref:Peptidase S1 domain-containing protein n=2 Tax=Anopheles coluzzii TaxID=1518534 RepID=A0A6E8VMQ1_ANOCL
MLRMYSINMKVSVAAILLSALCVSVIGGVVLDPVERPSAKIAPSPLATDGYLAYPGQFLHHAALRFKTKSSTRVYGCAGSLITPVYILTTAACVNHNSVEYAFAILGSLFNGNTEWEQHINISMNGVRIHPPSPMYGHNDIATIHMDHPATLNEYVQPIRLPRLSDTRTYEMMEGTATSALDGEGLRYLRNQVMSNADCHEAIQPLYNISAQHICTDTYIGGSLCGRNSGSALTVEDENGQMLVGVGNIVFLCDLHYPIRHIRVLYFREWIELNSDYKFEP